MLKLLGYPSTGKCFHCTSPSRHLPAIYFSGSISSHSNLQNATLMYKFTCAVSYREKYFFFLNALNCDREWLQLFQIKIVYVKVFSLNDFKVPKLYTEMPLSTTENSQHCSRIVCISFNIRLYCISLGWYHTLGKVDVVYLKAVLSEISAAGQRMAVFGWNERLEELSKALQAHISQSHILWGHGVIFLLFQSICNFFSETYIRL